MKNFLQDWWNEIARWLREPCVIWRSETSDLVTTIEVRRWLPMVAFLLALAWYVAGPAPVALMTAVTLGGMLLASLLWARASALKVRGQRRMRFAAMQVGDELEEQITLNNDTALPVLWAEFVDRSNIPGYTVSSARAAGPKGQISWRARTICTRRGVFDLGPWELRIGEPFGCFIVRQLYMEKQQILVYPQLAALPEQILPHHGAMGDNRPLNQPLRAETIASTSVRAYAPGDPLRHIHWRTSARRGDTFVKVFSPEAASNVWLVPDFDADVHVGQEENSSLEMMVTVTASLAAKLLQQNLSVGMFTITGKETVVLPRQGQVHLWPILQALAPLQPVSSQPLDVTLGQVKSLISGNDLVVVMTPSLHPEWIAPLRTIARIRGGTRRAEVILLDAASFAEAEKSPQAAQEGVNKEISTETFQMYLLENGITTHLLRQQDVRLISGYYGEISRWEFSVGGTGRAFARRTPRGVAIQRSERGAGWEIPG